MTASLKWPWLLCLALGITLDVEAEDRMLGRYTLPSETVRKIEPSFLRASLNFRFVEAPTETDPEVHRFGTPDAVLTPFMVNEKKVLLSEADVLTYSGRVVLAQKRYISPLYRNTLGPLSQIAGYYLNFLTIFAGWHPTEAEAMVLYEQDERLRRLSELDSLLRLEGLDGSKDEKALRSEKFKAILSTRGLDFPTRRR